MPYQVMVEFGTVADAKRFVREVIYDDGVVVLGEGSGDLDNNYTTYDILYAKPVAAFRVPTQFCDNTDGHRGDRGWTKGPTYGWWICGSCKLPTENWAKSPDRLRYSMGVNLLPPPYGTHDRNDLQSKAIWRDLIPESTSKSEE